MTKKDVPVVHRLLREYLSQFNLVPAMNQEEIEHWLLPRENIIDTYLVEVKKKKKNIRKIYMYTVYFSVIVADIFSCIEPSLRKILVLLTE